MTKNIEIRGARVNNLKNVNLDIPINKITCFYGPSGSGKTSLAFHTLYAESKRRFLNSFPTYLKFFSERPAPVDVDLINPVLPVFGLPQINPVVGTRSTVSDIMHLTELFQSFYYNFSDEFCPDHKESLITQSFDDYLSKQIDDTKGEIFHLFIKRHDFIDFFNARPFPTRSASEKGELISINDFEEENEYWEVLRFKARQVGKLGAKIKEFLEKETSIYLASNEELKLKKLEFIKDIKICQVEGCKVVGNQSLSVLNFSPYNAIGACSNCSGFGETLDWDEGKLFDLKKTVNEKGVLLLNYKRFDGQLQSLKQELKKNKISLDKPLCELPEKFWKILYEGGGRYTGFNSFFKYLESRRYKMNVRIFIRNIQKNSICNVCNGTRINRNISNFFFETDLTYYLESLTSKSIGDVFLILNEIEKNSKLINKEAKLALKKMVKILSTACGIGLGHLSLLRKSKSVSAGEYQRLLLLKYLSYEGTGSLFIFDEPSLGLSEVEMNFLFKGFEDLVRAGNTVVLIDHNEFMRKKSYYLVEVGPGAGVNGGEIVKSGLRKEFSFRQKKLNLEKISIKKKSYIKINSPIMYEKKFNNFKISRNEINLAVGRSGTGKSVSMINILANELTYLNSEEYLNIARGSFKKIEGITDFENVIIVDANLNRYTSRSTVGSMTGLFSSVRKHFLNLKVSQAMGLVEGHFSNNSELGQCRKCEGRGHLIIEMQFLEDIILTCEDCDGKKLKPIYAEISDGNMSVYDAFSKPLNEFIDSIKLTPKFQRIVKLMEILNLDYLSLNRQINSLSGGEKQRIYLLNKLQKDLKNSIIFFENISFGLSRVELEKICILLNDLVKKGNTIVVIDQNPIFEKISGHLVKFD